MDLIDAMHIKGRTIKKISNYINLGEGYRSYKYTLHIYFHHKCVLLLILLFEFLLFLHLMNIAINNNHFFVTLFSTFVYLMFSQMLRVILWQMFWHFTRNTKVRFIIRSNGFIAITPRKKTTHDHALLVLKCLKKWLYMTDSKLLFLTITKFVQSVPKACVAINLEKINKLQSNDFL